MMMERFRRYAVRVFAVLLCVAALADLRPFSGSGEPLPIVVLDISASVGGGSAALPGGLRVRPYWVLLADGRQEVVGTAEPARLPRGATHIGSALRYVGATWPGVDALILTDGRGTEGDALAAARILSAAGGRLFVGPPARSVADVGLLRAHLVGAAPEARVRVRVASSTSGGAEVRLSRARRIVDRQTLRLRAGDEINVELRDPDAPVEGCAYRIVLVPDAGTPDDDPGNNSLALSLHPESRVVLTWGLGQEAARLRAPGLVIRRVDESDGDPAPGEFDSADCLVLSNLAWRDVGAAAATEIEHFVAGGGSLLVLGGPEAYAGGGWAGTRFERHLSPLRVPREEGTGLALVLVLDRSGSTVGTALAHLKEAARRALQGIVPGERIAILPFAHRPAPALLEPGVLGAEEPERLEHLLAALSRLEASGDTDLPAALVAAGLRAQGIDARERRVVLLTDGDPDHPADEGALRAAGHALRERGIGFAAFVVGDPAAVRMLRAFVASDPDDVQPLDDPQDLPARLMHWLGGVRGRKAELPRPTRLVPAPGGDLPIVASGFLPRNVQHLEVARNEGAHALAFAEYDDLLGVPPVPFAASRRVGAGRATALAWGPAYERPRDRAEAVARLQPLVRRLATEADRGLAADVDADVLIVRSPADTGAGGLRARSAAGSSDLQEVQPGVFRGPLPPHAEAGVWVRAQPASSGAVEEREERPLRLPALPPEESRGVGLDRSRMAALAEAGGGRRLEGGEQPPPPERVPGMPLAPWLLLGACGLLILDRLWSKPLGSVADS